MQNSCLRLFIYGQICLYLLLGLSIVLKPAYLKGDGGLSNYGIHWPTVVSYSLAFIFAAVFSYLASLSVKTESKSIKSLKTLLDYYALLLILLLASTYLYKHSLLLRNVHISIGSALLLFQLSVTVWIFLKLNKSAVMAALSLVQLASVIIGALSLMGVIHLLLASQVLSALSFGAAIYLSLAKFAKT